MYVFNKATGEVLLNGEVIAPTSDASSQSYLAWLEWEEQGNVMEEINEPAPNLQYILTHYQFLTRLSIEEHVALEQAMPDNVLLRVAKHRFEAAKEIDLSNQEVKNFVALMVTLGILTQERSEQILEPASA